MTKRKRKQTGKDYVERVFDEVRRKAEKEKDNEPTRA